MSVTGTIGSNSIESYVRSLHRTHSICDPGQAATLVLLPTYPDSISTADEVALYENGTLVLTGYVQRFFRERPSYDWKIEIVDTYTRVTNYFLTDKLTTGFDPTTDQPIPGYAPQTVDYWIDYLCEQCGISYSIDTSTGGKTVPQGTQIGLRTVHDALFDVVAYAALAMFVSPSGVLHFKRIRRNAPTWTLTNGYELHDSTSDEFTRNTIKIFGYTWNATKRIFASAHVDVDGIDPERITSVASPYIQDQATADELANFLLSELGVQSRVVTIKAAGDPTVKLGYAARINVAGTDYTDAISSLDFRTDQSGYVMDVTIGERCPRIAGWSAVMPPVYAGTTTYGVYKSTDGGANWTEYNTGLPAGSKYVSRLGFNLDGDGMALVNGTLWYTDGNGSWTQRTLPAPINSAGDSPAPGYGSIKAVTAGGILNKFYAMTVNAQSSGSAIQNSRTWIYETTNGGTSWTSTEFNDTTGSGYHFYGLDLSSQYGAPYVIGTSGSVYYSLFIKGDMSREGYRNYFGTNYCGDINSYGIMDFDLLNYSIIGSGSSQVLSMNFYTYYDVTPSAEYCIYKIFDDTLNWWEASPGPYAVAEFIAVTFSGHNFTINIPYRAKPFVALIGLYSSTSVGFNQWSIFNGTPFTCEELIAGPGYYMNCGAIQYTFSP